MWMRLSRALRAVHGASWHKNSHLTRAPLSRLYPHLSPPSYPQLWTRQTRSFASTMPKFSAAERFLADREAPYCSLAVAKSFAQLRSVFSATYWRRGAKRWTKSWRSMLTVHGTSQLEGEAVCTLCRSGLLGRRALGMGSQLQCQHAFGGRYHRQVRARKSRVQAAHLRSSRNFGHGLPG